MIRSVKKLFLIFLLVVLPFQVSWAAAAVYCQHENEVSTSHPGHHEHQHAQDHDDADQANDKAKGKVHADCAPCHGTAVGLLSASGTLEHFVFSTITIPASPDSYTSILPLRPERPKWPLAV